MRRFKKSPPCAFSIEAHGRGLSLLEKVLDVSVNTFHHGVILNTFLLGKAKKVQNTYGFIFVHRHLNGFPIGGAAYLIGTQVYLTSVLPEGASIPTNRQQLADYLEVDSSALSNELSKMQKEGLLTVNRNTFRLPETLPI